MKNTNDTPSNQTEYGAIIESSETDSLPSSLNSEEIHRNYRPQAINESSETDSLVESNTLLLDKLKSYESKPRKSFVRFYILLLFSGFTFMQGMIWNTWGPIADSAELVYGWDSSVIALLSNWGPIAFVPATFVFPVVMNMLGLRYGILIGMALTFVGATLRIFTTTNPIATILMHFGHFLNGFAGPVSMGASTTISANWFPCNERTLATGIGGSANYLGVAISFIIGPLMVPQVNTNTSNNSANVSAAVLSEVRTGIFHMMYVQAAVCAFLFIIILIYYPSRPKHPPSITAHEERSHFMETLRLLLSNRSFWVLFVCYGIATGVNTAWSSFLFPNLSMLKEISVTQMFVGWLGFYSTIAGVVSTIVAGFISDLLPKWKKSFLVICMFLAGVFALLFTLFCNETIRVGSNIYLVVYLTGILLTVFVNATIGIYYELSAEVGYPIPEATSTIILTLSNNLFGFVFLILALFPQLGTSWMNWCQAASFFGVVPLLILTPVRYRRLDKDKNT